MKKLRLILTIFTLFTLTKVNAQEIREFMDLQSHPTMDVTWGFFDSGLKWLAPGQKPKLSYKHTFNSVIYADYLANNSGSRIIINGAIVAERARSFNQASSLILEQIRQIDEFAANNSEYFAVARSPEEVRHLVHNTNKTIFIHSIEGARKLIRNKEDAKFWASKGVAFITLIHLLDDEFGGSAINPDFIGRTINTKGTLRKRFRPRLRRGLTDHGKKAIEWIANAGMLIDMTHMSPASKDDALEIMRRKGIPPLLTHSVFKPLQNHDRGISPKQLLEVYRLGGLFSTPIGGDRLHLHGALPKLQKRWEQINGCQDSVDSYRFTFNYVQKFLDDNIANILGSHRNVNFEQLSEQEKTKLSIGWQSDFNGWINHARPRYGKGGCFQMPTERKVSIIDKVGLAHPGLLPDFWQLLEKEGMRVESLKRASEKFLQMWSRVRARTQYPWI